MNFLLNASGEVDISTPIEGFGDKLLYGGQMLLIGMLTVFGVLATLWITLILFKLCFHDLPHKKTAAKEIKADPTPVYQAPVASDDEIIAVIAAAIATAESECGSNKQFRVVSFKRK